MIAMDEVNRLKAERRAAIAADAEAARLAEEAARRERLARLNADLDRELADGGCQWLKDFADPKAEVLGDDTVAHVRFAIPGHRTVVMCLRRTDSNPERWSLADRLSRRFDPHPWYVLAAGGGSTPFDVLADALIAAEIEGWTPPAPAREEWPITAEVEHAARAAWAAMLPPVGQTHEPLPPLQALDMVQDEAGERPLAVLAIHYAAALWLDSWRPEEAAGDRGADGVKHGHHTANFMAATAARAHLIPTDAGAAPAYELAEKCRAEVQERSLDVTREYESEGEDSRYGIDEYQLAINWHTWAQSARLAIDLCRAVTEAAEPKPAPSTPATPPGPPNPPRPPDRREVA